MKRCINCGKTANSNNEIICSHCGAQLINIKTVECNNCGTAVNPNFKFCKKCGMEFNSAYINFSDDYGAGIQSHGSEVVRKDKNSKLPAIAVIAVLIVGIAVTATCIALLLKDKDAQDTDTSIPVAMHNDDSKGNEKASDTSNSEKKDVHDKVEEEIPDKPFEFSEKPAESAENTLYDYDSDNDDWYRLRKSKNDPSTQVGAYKTVEKALSYAEIYLPQGYVLYDKDFNEIDVSIYGIYPNESQNRQTVDLYDYDPDNDDWYRLRKSKNDPSTQIGAYKTFEKALSYAEIYRPQGYVLYDKDFNVVE